MLISRPTASSMIFGVFQVISGSPSRRLDGLSLTDAQRRTRESSCNPNARCQNKSTVGRVCNRDLGSRSSRDSSLISKVPFGRLLRTRRSAKRSSMQMIRRCHATPDHVLALMDKHRKRRQESAQISCESHYYLPPIRRAKDQCCNSSGCLQPVCTSDSSAFAPHRRHRRR